MTESVKDQLTRAIEAAKKVPDDLTQIMQVMKVLITARNFDSIESHCYNLMMAQGLLTYILSLIFKPGDPESVIDEALQLLVSESKINLSRLEKDRITIN